MCFPFSTASSSRDIPLAYQNTKHFLGGNRFPKPDKVKRENHQSGISFDSKAFSLVKYYEKYLIIFITEFFEGIMLSFY
jgi:hypothetical protein